MIRRRAYPDPLKTDRPILKTKEWNIMEKVTAGRDYLGDFAPEFARFNDDVLFGQVWAREEALSPKLRSLITVSALMGAGILDQSMEGHLAKAKANGVTKAEMVELITQLAFYTGWPKAWAVFSMAKAVFGEEADKAEEVLFGLGEKLVDVHFNKAVYVKPIFGFDKPMLVDNVTFEPGCRNNWHVHQKGQTLFVVSGRGWYQEEGKAAQELHPGDIVEIPAGIKHWHGAARDSWFTHLAVEDYTKGAPDWYGSVDDELYDSLP